jgi:DNA gyrase inhibitor GyrI
VEAAALLGKHAADRYDFIHTTGEMYRAIVPASEDDDHPVIDRIRNFPRQRPQIGIH